VHGFQFPSLFCSLPLFLCLYSIHAATADGLEEGGEKKEVTREKKSRREEEKGEREGLRKAQHSTAKQGDRSSSDQGLALPSVK